MNTMNTYICLENIRSLHNVGAIFRTCSFFNIKNIILLGYTAQPKEKSKDKCKESLNTNNIFNEDLLKTSLGAEKDLNIKRINTIEELFIFSEQNGLKILAIEQEEKSIKIKYMTKDIVENSIIIFGNETEGIDKKIREKADYLFEIERFGNHNSLNVATTAGIILEKVANL